MQSFFWQILADRRVYARIQEEMITAVEDGIVPASGNISWSEAQNLPYFQACLKEAMRVRPAVGLNIVRMVPPEGAELDGHFFPGGVSVAVNGWVLHRDKATFGQDADVYRPERWLGDVEEAKRMERYMFQVSRLPGFSLPHPCLGVFPDDVILSSVVAATCASAATSHSSRSTRSARDSFVTTTLNLSTRRGSCGPTPPSLLSRRAWRSTSQEAVNRSLQWCSRWLD